MQRLPRSGELSHRGATSRLAHGVAGGAAIAAAAANGVFGVRVPRSLRILQAHKAWSNRQSETSDIAEPISNVPEKTDRVISISSHRARMHSGGAESWMVPTIEINEPLDGTDSA